MEEHAPLGHGERPRDQPRQCSEDQSEHKDVVVGQQAEGDQELAKDRAHCVAQELGGAAAGGGLAVVLHLHHAVDVGVVGHLAGHHHAVEELHGLHLWHAPQPQKHGCRHQQGRALEHNHRFVAQPIGEEENGHKDCQI